MRRSSHSQAVNHWLQARSQEPGEGDHHDDAQHRLVHWGALLVVAPRVAAAVES